MGKLVFTREQRQNLTKLADYLAALPADYSHFGMEDYFYADRCWVDPHQVSLDVYNECGTVACAVGHGPAAGISAKGYEGWNEYAADKFGVGSGSYNNLIPAFEWCFESFWSKHDDTPQGAAARIRYMLAENDVPVAFVESRGGYGLYAAGSQYRSIKALYLAQ